MPLARVDLLLPWCEGVWLDPHLWGAVVLSVFGGTCHCSEHWSGQGYAKQCSPQFNRYSQYPSETQCCTCVSNCQTCVSNCFIVVHLYLSNMRVYVFFCGREAVASHSAQTRSRKMSWSGSGHRSWYNSWGGGWCPRREGEQTSSSSHAEAVTWASATGGAGRGTPPPGSSVTLPHGPKGHPDWTKPADEVLHIVFPFNLKRDLSPAFWAAWQNDSRERDLSMRIRGARGSQYKKQYPNVRVPNTLTVLGNRALALDFLQDFIPAVIDHTHADAEQTENLTDEPQRGSGDPTDEPQEFHLHGSITVVDPDALALTVPTHVTSYPACPHVFLSDPEKVVRLVIGRARKPKAKATKQKRRLQSTSPARRPGDVTPPDWGASESEPDAAVPSTTALSGVTLRSSTKALGGLTLRSARSRSPPPRASASVSPSLLTLPPKAPPPARTLAPAITEPEESRMDVTAEQPDVVAAAEPLEVELDFMCEGALQALMDDNFRLEGGALPTALESRA